MLSGLNNIILKAPKSEKRSMLIDTTNYGLKVCESFKKHLNSNDYLIAVNNEIEFSNDSLEIKVKERDTKIIKQSQEIEKLKAQIKSMLKD